MASPTVLMFSASSSGISTSNSSSIAITSSTMSRLSAPRSSMNELSGLISSSPTPSWSAMIDLTFVSMGDVAIFLFIPPKRSCVDATSTAPALHVHAAVDLQNLASDIAGEIAGEEDDRIGDLVGRTQPRERNRLEHL